MQPWLTMKKLISSWSVHVLKRYLFVIRRISITTESLPSNLIMLCSYELDHLDTASFTFPGGRHRVLENSSCRTSHIIAKITFGYVQFQGSWHRASSQELHSKQSIEAPAEMKKRLSQFSLFASLNIFAFLMRYDLNKQSYE